MGAGQSPEDSFVWHSRNLPQTGCAIMNRMCAEGDLNPPSGTTGIIGGRRDLICLGRAAMADRGRQERDVQPRRRGQRRRFPGRSSRADDHRPFRPRELILMRSLSSTLRGSACRRARRLARRGGVASNRWRAAACRSAALRRCRSLVRGGRSYGAFGSWRTK